MRLAAVLLALLLSGCATEPRREPLADVRGPEPDAFVATLIDPPSHVYSSFAFRRPQVVQVLVERPAPGVARYQLGGDSVEALPSPPPGAEGPAIAREVCARFDVGEPDCANLTLHPGEYQWFSPEWATLPEGATTFTVLNASVPMTTGPVPRLGEWIETRYVLMRADVTELANDRTPNATWTYVLDVEFRNGTTPVRLFFTPTREEISWAPGRIRLEIPSNATPTRGPREACADMHLPEEGRQVESGVLLWQEARIMGGCA